MNRLELWLRDNLPRAEADPTFERVLLETLLLEATDASRHDPDAGVEGRRRAYFGVGGAMVGAALAVGVAVGLRLRRGTEAA